MGFYDAVKIIWMDVTLTQVWKGAERQMLVNGMILCELYMHMCVYVYVYIRV